MKLDIRYSLVDRDLLYFSHFQVGQAMKAEIETYIQRSAYLQQVMIPFYASKAGAVLYEQTLTILRAQCPQYLAELEGVAEGAEQPFNTIMMLNINCPVGSKGGHHVYNVH